MSFILVNNFNTTLSAASSSTATTFTVSSSANLPTLAAGEVLPITLNDAATRLVFEICYVTSISGNILTVERAQEGTSAQNWNVGDYIWNGPTAGTSLLQNTTDPFTTSGLITANGGMTLQNGTTMETLVSLFPGRVSIFPPGWTGSGSPALVIDPFGNPVSITNSTTDGIQEAINYAVTNNYNVHIYGANSNSTTTQSYNCSTGINIPPTHEFSITSDAVTITFNTSNTSGYAFNFDSQDGITVDLKGQIVWQPTGGNVIQFNPVNPAPTDNDIYIVSSIFRFGQIVANSATNGIYLESNTTNSYGINGIKIESGEINGGGYGVSIETPTVGTIVHNLFILNSVHSQSTGLINGTPYMLSEQTWVTASYKSNVIGITIGASPFNFVNTYPTPIMVSINGGSVSQIEIFNGQGSGMITGLTNGAFQLAPGNSVSVTYSAAPAMNYMSN